MSSGSMNSAKGSRGNVGYMVRLAALVAVMLVLEATGLGMIKTPGLEFTIMHVPVIVGAIVMGPAAGAILGGVFGCISFWECFGRSAFGAVLLSINPVGTFLTCIPTRILMGFLCGVVFVAFKKIGRGHVWTYGAASLIGALLNTLFFMGVLVLFFYNTDYIQGFADMLGADNVLQFLIAFVGVQGVLEAIICAASGTVVAKAIDLALNRGR